MNIKDSVKNNIIMAMRLHIDSNIMDILSNVINNAFMRVEMVEIESLPATIDDTNKYILELFDVQKAPKLSEKTVEYYKSTINQLIDTVQKPLLKMTQMDIECYLDSMRIKGNSPTSLNNRRRNICSFFAWMRKIHLIIENPCDGIEKYQEIKKPVDHLDSEQFEKLKEGCHDKRDRALIEVFRSTAMRVGELQRVRISDINFMNGEILVYGKKTRTYRTAFLDSVAMTYLQEYLKERAVSYNSDEALFVCKGTNTGIKSSTIRAILKKMMDRSSIEKNIYPHLFRKTTATNIVRRGGSVHDAGEYLGHKDNTVAGVHYVAMDKEHTYDIFRRYVAVI